MLADEINRAPAKTQAALLEAMQERRVTVDGTSHALPESFTVFATQNPIEFEGTYPLPEAELDRFLVKVLIGYPEERVEQGILTRVLGGFEADLPAELRHRAGGGRRRASRRCATPCRRVRVEPSLVAYITAIVRATRAAPVLTLGASPRGSVALLKMAQAAALLDGRPYVVPDDVKELAPAVLRHRVAVAPELELEGITADIGAPGDHREDRGAPVIAWSPRAAGSSARRCWRAWRRSRCRMARRRRACCPRSTCRWLARARCSTRLARPAPRTLEVTREAPVAFARRARRRGALPLAPPGRGAARRSQVRERLPDPLGGADTPTRTLAVPPRRGTGRAAGAGARAPRTGQRRRARRAGARPTRPRLAAGDG